VSGRTCRGRVEGLRPLADRSCVCAYAWVWCGSPNKVASDEEDLEEALIKAQR
jgi:hypothetical protein